MAGKLSPSQRVVIPLFRALEMKGSSCRFRLARLLFIPTTVRL